MLRKVARQLSVWLKTLGLLAIPPVTRHQRKAVLGAFSSLSRKLSVLPLDDLLAGLPDSTEVRLAVLEKRPHNMTAIEIFCLAAITRAFSPSVALEIGTYDGRSTMAIARNMAGKVYTVNLGPDYLNLHPEEAHRIDIQLSGKVKSGERGLSPETDRIVQIFSDSTKLDFEQFGTVDFIVIDGGHDYEVVKADTENALRIINRRRGVILWHDAVDFGVGKYLPELALPISIIDGTVLAVLIFENDAARELLR